MLFLTCKIKKVRTWWGGSRERVEYMAVANEAGDVVAEGVKDCLAAIHGHRVVLIDGWCKELDGVVMEWYPIGEQLAKRLDGHTEYGRLRLAGQYWKEEKEAAVERFMRAVHGVNTLQLAGMVSARAAGWARYVLDCMVRDCSMQMEGSDVVLRIPEQKFAFYEGIGLEQGQAQVDFCKAMTEGFVQQLYSISKGM